VKTLVDSVIFSSCFGIFSKSPLTSSGFTSSLCLPLELVCQCLERMLLFFDFTGLLVVLCSIAVNSMFCLSFSSFCLGDDDIVEFLLCPLADLFLECCTTGSSRDLPAVTFPDLLQLLFSIILVILFIISFVFISGTGMSFFVWNKITFSRFYKILSASNLF